LSITYIGKNDMPRGRPELYPIKKLIRFDQNMLDNVEEWRRGQTPIPPVSEAIRRLVERGLAAPAPRKPKGKST